MKKNNILNFLFVSTIVLFILGLVLTKRTNENMWLPILIAVIAVIATIYSFLFNDLIIYILLLLSILYIPIISIFKVDILRYLLDYFIIITLIKSFSLIRSKKVNSMYKNILILLNLIFFIIALIGIMINQVNPYAVINGLWKYFRFFIIFWYIVNVKLLDKTVININKLIIIINLIQLPITIFQYLIGLDRDFIGGVFRAGGTGILMLFNFWGICYYTAELKCKKISIKKYIALTSILIIPSILGEIKATFLFLPVVFIFIFVDFKISIRNTVMIVMGIISSILLMKLLIVFYPAFATLFTDKDYFMEYTFLGKYGDYGLNRFSAIVYVLKNVLIGILPMLFGIGIGQGTPARELLFTGKFYIEHSDLRYEWFQAPYMILEVGILGLIFYISLLLLIAYMCKFSKIKFNNDIDSIVMAIGAFSIVHVMNIFYNQVMFEYYGAFFWIVLALGLNKYFNGERKYEKSN